MSMLQKLVGRMRNADKSGGKPSAISVATLNDQLFKIFVTEKIRTAGAGDGNITDDLQSRLIELAMMSLNYAEQIEVEWVEACRLDNRLSVSENSIPTGTSKL